MELKRIFSIKNLRKLLLFIYNSKGAKIFGDEPIQTLHQLLELATF